MPWRSRYVSLAASSFVYHLPGRFSLVGMLLRTAAADIVQSMVSSHQPRLGQRPPAARSRKPQSPTSGEIAMPVDVVSMTWDQAMDTANCTTDSMKDLGDTVKEVNESLLERANRLPRGAGSVQQHRRRKRQPDTGAECAGQMVITGDVYVNANDVADFGAADAHLQLSAQAATRWRQGGPRNDRRAPHQRHHHAPSPTARPTRRSTKSATRHAR